MEPDELARHNIRRVRGRLGLTLDDLASRTGMHRNTLNNLESGATRGIRIGQVFQAAAGLGVAPIHLMVPWEKDEILEIPGRQRQEVGSRRDGAAPTYREMGHVGWSGQEAYWWINGTLRIDGMSGWFVGEPSTYYGQRPSWRWTDDQVDAFTQEGD